MSNEFKDWLDDIACEKAIYNTAKDIYEYAYGVFFGKEQWQKNLRIEYGSKGAESTVLEYIRNNFIKPYDRGWENE